MSPRSAKVSACTAPPRIFGRLLDGMMLVACLLLLVMTLLIGADVGLRNARLGGVPWSNEVSEYILYLVTLLAAPWLLRAGQHIRVDILLQALPPRLGWLLEWLATSSASPARSISSGTAEGAGGELCVGRDLDQDAGAAGVVAAGADAARVRAGVDRVRVPHVAAGERPSARPRDDAVSAS